MTRIGVRELRQHASRYLERVKAGEIVEVTERGKLVALLVSPIPAVSARDQLIASGRLVPAKSAFHLPERRQVVSGRETGTDVLTEQRQERLT
jgi:prevent-host-death family protein